MAQSIPKLLVIGATHGNEMPGIRVVKALQQRAQRKDIGIEAIYGNVKAMAARTRYLEMDMNRISRTVANKESNPDAQRAKELYTKYPCSSERIGLDLHTTASNTGIMPIIVRNDDFEFNINMAKAIQKQTSEPVRVFAPPLPPYGEPENLIPNICTKHLGIEVGPVPHGEDSLKAAIDMTLSVAAVKKHIESGANKISDTIGVYTPVGAIIAQEGFSVKETFVGKDFEALSPDTVVMSSGSTDKTALEVVPDRLKEKLLSKELYPVFVGEPVYLTEEVKKICVLCTKEEM